MMDWQTLRTFLPLIAEGAWNTLWLTLATLACGFLLALPVALCRNASRLGPRLFALGFVFTFRGSPLLVLLYLIYYGSPEIALIRHTALWAFFRDPILCAILALSLNSAGYLTEVIAGALRAVPRGSIDAGRALGLRRILLFRLVAAPLALRLGLRAYGNEVVFVIKGTSVASLVTIVDVMGAARQIYYQTFDPITPLLVAGLIYLAGVAATIQLIRTVEMRLAVVVTPASPSRGGRAPPWRS